MTETPSWDSIPLYSPTSEVGETNHVLETIMASAKSDQMEQLLKIMVEVQSNQQISSKPSSSQQVNLPQFDPASTDAESWCVMVDEYVKVHEMAGMSLVAALCSALKRDAADWLIKCRPFEKTWSEIRAEFLAVFSRPADLLQMVEEVANGRESAPLGTTLLDEGLHVLRLALHLIKNRESDEALATLFACHVVGRRSAQLKRRLQENPPKDTTSFSDALRGSLGKRLAQFPADYQNSGKRRALAPVETNTRKFQGKCYRCGRLGHKSLSCTSEVPNLERQYRIKDHNNQKKSASVICFSCGKSGHISTRCAEFNKKSQQKVAEEHVDLCEEQKPPVETLKLHIAVSKEEADEHHHGKLPYNGFSDEFLDRLEPNGNIPAGKGYEWNNMSGHDRVKRQLSVSSDSKLLDDDIREETRVILRPKKPPRPKSEVLLNQGTDHRRTKRFSAFGGDSPFGKSEAYIKLEQLGEGSYATVYKGYSNLKNQVVALKEIRLQEEEGAPFTAIREASLLKELKHANIVTLHDIVHTRETLTFVFEYVHTDLSQYLERHTFGLDPRNVRLFLFQLLRGLSYCHKRRVLHRDVKPQNLLISEIGELKLADFGLARAKSVPSHTYSHEVVTLWYRPPDVLLGSTEYSTSLDMWGVGCIFVEMIVGQAIFPGVRDTYDQLDKIFKVLGTPTEEDWEGVTRLPGYKPHKLGMYRPKKLGLYWPRLHDVVQGEQMATALLQLDPQNRIGADEAMVHPYFSGLPKKLLELPDDVSIFSVEGVHLYPEHFNFKH